MRCALHGADPNWGRILARARRVRRRARPGRARSPSAACRWSRAGESTSTAARSEAARRARRSAEVDIRIDLAAWRRAAPALRLRALARVRPHSTRSTRRDAPRRRQARRQRRARVRAGASRAWRGRARASCVVHGGGAQISAHARRAASSRASWAAGASPTCRCWRACARPSRPSRTSSAPRCRGRRPASRPLRRRRRAGEPHCPSSASSAARPRGRAPRLEAASAAGRVPAHRAARRATPTATATSTSTPTTPRPRRRGARRRRARVPVRRARRARRGRRRDPRRSPRRARRPGERRDAAEAGGLRAAAAARRRPRHDRLARHRGDAVSLRERAEAALLPTYPERPLAFVRGPAARSGTRTARPTSTSSPGLAVCSLGHGHPAPAARWPRRPRRSATSRTCSTASRRWRSPSGSASCPDYGRAFFCNSGAEAVEAAHQARPPPGRARGGCGQARDRLPRGLLPRPHARDAGGRLGERQARAVRAAARRASARAAQRPSTRWRPPSARHRGGAARARAGRGRRLAAGAPATWARRGSSATATTPCCSATRCRRASAAAARGSAPGSGVEPDALPLAKGLASACPIGALLTRRSRRRLRARRPRHDVRRHARRSRPPRSRCSTRSSARAWSRTRPRSARTSCAAPRALPGVADVRGAGLLLAVELADAPRGRGPRALLGRGILVNAITPTALRLCRRCASHRAKRIASVPLSRMC